jgi:hypothetical protein
MQHKRKLKWIGITLLFAAATSLAGAADIADRKSLTLDGARRAIDAAVTQSHNNRTGGVIAVVDESGNLMALERVDGAFAAGANISRMRLARLEFYRGERGPVAITPSESMLR